MRLTTLGVSSHYPLPGAPCVGMLLEHDGTAVWIDAGPGTLAELQRHAPLAGLSAAWISHGHADHAADLLPAFYAYRYGDVGAPARLPVLAPGDVRGRLAGFLGPASGPELDRVFAFDPLSDGGGRAFGGLSLRWSAVRHDAPAFALRAEAAGASLVYTGDSAPCAALDELARGCDLLVSEAGTDVRQPGDAPVHFTPEEAGELAARAGARRLLLTHLALGLRPDDAVRRAASRFDGPVEAAVVSGEPMSVDLPTVES
ncbi:MBL fold metallo-hydrolase [Leifsonia sp. LS1]|uniref:MBL fold metallo-hydrolase n=1 Tax=Leifsonia sp. LS1 TaxID=2828483 RepID=UPI001CFC83EF|nr:MBL fold metallo-hydrolase [Leifsonia sp. LS1]GIT81846.1 MBL fold metallo-hydrolase [Leifsonia sp. LS1]